MYMYNNVPITQCVYKNTINTINNNSVYNSFLFVYNTCNDNYIQWSLPPPPPPLPLPPPPLLSPLQNQCTGADVYEFSNGSHQLRMKCCHSDNEEMTTEKFMPHGTNH